MSNNFKGVIIEESIEDKSVLKKVKILSTKVEKVTKKHNTPWLKQLTLHTVEVLWDKAREYGISLGIPEYQVDFHPEVEEWKR